MLSIGKRCNQNTLRFDSREATKAALATASADSAADKSDAVRSGRTAHEQTHGCGRLGCHTGTWLATDAVHRSYTALRRVRQAAAASSSRIGRLCLDPHRISEWILPGSGYVDNGALKRLTEAVLADAAETISEDELSSVRGRPADVDVGSSRVTTGSPSNSRQLGSTLDEHEAGVERTVRLALIEHQHLDSADPRAPLLRLAIVRRDESLLLRLLASLRSRPGTRKP